MATTIQRLDDEPIIIVTYEGTLGTEQLAEFAPHGAQLQRESPVPLYWIIDVHATTSDFAQIVKILAHQSRGNPGTASNAPGRVFMVGSAYMTRLYVDAMRQPQFGGLDIPMFPNLDDALAAVRVRLHASD